MGKGTRKKLFVDEPRMQNFSNFTAGTIDRKHLRSFMPGYFWYDDIAEDYFGISRGNLVWVVRDQTNLEKNLYIRNFDNKKSPQTILFLLDGKNNGLF